MNEYKLTLIGGSQGALRISAALLQEVVAALLEGARLATRFAALGESVRKGPRPSWLDAACDIEITGLRAGSAVLTMEARTLKEADEAKFGGDGLRALFEESDRDFGVQTAVDLFGEVLARVVEGEADDVVADRALLDACLRFARLAGDGFEEVQIEGLRGRRKPLVITKDHAVKIERLRDETPPPEAARVTGTLDTISASRSEVTLKLKDGTRVPARIEDHDPEGLRVLFGKTVVISGMAHYRHSGRLLMLGIESISEASAGDHLFEATPFSRKRMLVATPLAQDESSGVSAFFGTWPGTESEEELLEALKASE